MKNKWYFLLYTTTLVKTYRLNFISSLLTTILLKIAEAPPTLMTTNYCRVFSEVRGHQNSEHLLIRPALYLNCLWVLHSWQRIVLHCLQCLHIGQPWLFLSHTKTKTSKNFNNDPKRNFKIWFSKLFLHVFGLLIHLFLIH